MCEEVEVLDDNLTDLVWAITLAMIEVHITERN